MKPYTKENIINKTPLENVEIGGYTADLMNVFFEKRIFGDYGKNVVYKEAESAFETCADDEGIVGIWQGEFWGKWIISAVRVYKHTKNQELKDFIHKGALKNIGFQRENGYIGTYKNSENFIPPDVKETLKIMGWECDWNWNIWCRKYTLWALLEVYEMMSCFDGLIELHRVTGDEKYLTVCKNFYELAFYNPLLASSYKDGMWGARGARTHGRHITVDEQAKFKHNHCCVNNMPRGYMNMAEACVMQSADAIYINLYTEVNATLKDGTTVVISGDYLANSSAKIEIDFKDNSPCDVKLRIPQWSDKNTVVADGVTYSPETGYFTVKPQNNKCVIKVQFDITLKNEYNEMVTKVCDYASGTNIKFDDMRTFSIFF